MKLPDAPWWREDQYDLKGPGDGPDFGDASLWGPKGAALVQLWPDGRTTQGWGRDEFMANYNALEFNPRRIIYGYTKGRWAFAFVMRGARMICVDIDGKNGGFDHASELGFLPPTTAEVSMSGNGYHLFYEVEDEWDEREGFGRYRDVIGLVTGVDIRAVGCVYHKPTQRWNSRPLAKLPEYLSQTLLAKTAEKERVMSNIAKTVQLEGDELLMLHDELFHELQRPIPAGKRNLSLFAIGSKMRAAEYPNWEAALEARGADIGLDDDEVQKIISNIGTYGG